MENRASHPHPQSATVDKVVENPVEKSLNNLRITLWISPATIPNHGNGGYPQRYQMGFTELFNLF